MTLIHKLAAAGAALALGLAATAASATIVTATYSGKVLGTGISQVQLDGAVDLTGEFGGDPIDGSDFTAVFKFDTNLALFDPGTPSQLIGGSDFGLVDPIISAILTINGVGQAFSGVTTTIAAVVGNGIDTTSFHLINEFTFGLDGSAMNRVLLGQFFNPDLPLDLRAALSKGRVVVDPGAESFGFFLINAQDADLNTTHLAYGYLAADHLTVSAGVPEPATWGLMLAGLFGLGVALRGQRRKGLAALA